MSTRIDQLPFKEGLVLVVSVWKNMLKIKHKSDYFVINIPKDMAKASEGDVYKVEKKDHTQNGKPSKRLVAQRIKTTPIEILPMKEEKDVKLLRRGNGLLKIEIENEEYIVLENKVIGMDAIKEGEVMKLMGEKTNGMITHLVKYHKPIREEDLFT